MMAYADVLVEAILLSCERLILARCTSPTFLLPHDRVRTNYLLQWPSSLLLLIHRGLNRRIH